MTVAIKDKDLAAVDAEEVQLKIASDQGLTLKEFAVGFGFTYCQAKTVAKRTGFPMFEKRIFPSDFTMWRRQQLGLQSSPERPAIRPRKVAGRPDEFLSTHG